jgi:hypothetical protein
MMNWRGRPLTTHEVVVNLIGSTTTSSGLTVRAERDTGIYPKGIKIAKEVIDSLPPQRQDFHGDWNYTVNPPEEEAN